MHPAMTNNESIKISIFGLLISALVFVQLAAADTPARTLKDTLASAVSRQIEKAILSGNVNTLASLISKNHLTVNEVIIHGGRKISMLVFATMNGKGDIVRYLAEQGAELIDINWHPSGAKYKNTLINFANASRNRGIADILEGIEVTWSENFLDEKSISAAAASGDVDLIQNFLNNFEDVSKDRDTHMLAKKIIDDALLAALKNKEVEVIETILLWQISATNKGYLANLPAEMRPMHDEHIVSKAISLAEDIEEGKLYTNLAKTIARIADVPLPTDDNSDTQIDDEIKILESSEALKGLWKRLFAIASHYMSEGDSDYTFKEKHNLVLAYSTSIKRGLVTHIYFSRIETVIKVLRDYSDYEEDLDELLLNFVEFAPVVANPSLMATKLDKQGKSSIDDALAYAKRLTNGGLNSKKDNLKMLYDGLKELDNREYIEHFEQLIDEKTLAQIR